MMSAAVRDLHKAHPGIYQTMVVDQYPDLWLHNLYITQFEEPWIPGIVAESKGDEDRNRPTKRMEKDGIIILPMHYHLINEAASRNGLKPYHFIHGFHQHLEKELGIKVPVTEFRGDIHLSQEELRDAGPVSGQYWVIDAGCKADCPNKLWPTEYYQKVVDHFAGKIRFVQIGRNEDYHPALTGVINMIGKTTLRQLIILVKNSVGVLTPVSFPFHLAYAAPTRTRHPRPCVCIAGSREPSHWEAYPTSQYLHNCGAMGCKPAGWCWKVKVQPGQCENSVEFKNYHKTPLFPGETVQISKCLAMITPNDVIRAIDTFYEGGAITAHVQARSAVPVSPKHEVVKCLMGIKLVQHLKEGESYLIQFAHGWGDVLMFMPIYEELKHRYPKCKFSLTFHPYTDRQCVYPDIVPFEPQKYDKTFIVEWPMERPDLKLAKAAMGCLYEIGIEPIVKHAVLPQCESPIVLCHFHVGSNTNCSCPEKTAKIIWKEIEDAGFIPYEPEFVSQWVKGRGTIMRDNKKYEFIKASARDASDAATNLRSLIGLVQRSYAVIGVSSGVLNTGMSVMPDRCMGIRTFGREIVYGITNQDIPCVNGLSYTGGEVTKWLESLRAVKSKEAPIAGEKMIEQILNDDEMFDYYVKERKWDPRMKGEWQREYVVMLCEVLSITPRDKMLDVGCACGAQTSAMVDAGIEAYGIEPNKRFVKESPFANLRGRLQIGGVTSIPFPDNHFGVVHISQVLEHVPESYIPQALKELYRVTESPCGRLYASMPGPQAFQQEEKTHVTMKPRHWWADKLRAAGWILEPDDSQIYQLFHKHRVYNDNLWEHFICYKK